ncbi:IclR family transcriptional regulator [Pseudonocardia acidicola]|uniref:IclR family transcriptional regulator n=1 Tax=Pseudonocardia acidicola TaxID=2724939 RepID=A0ABX1S7D0_9PSEU|nr:IclR family transcriptional regulator [Pseudonocardia acidicola]NMH97446.1 IclR family transcriptional regulator [Pseudonocardia acidicola]
MAERSVTGRSTGPESAHRALDVLFFFRPNRPFGSVKEIAAELGIPLPTAHRYVALLRERDLLTEAERGRYHLTLRTLSLGEAAQAATGLIEVADPFVRDLVATIDETVLIAQLVGGRPVCMHRWEASRRVRLSFEPGQSLPPLHGASVKVLVGGLATPERRSYVQQVIGHEPALAERRAEFEKEVRLAAEHGWATSVEEIDEGVWAAAARIAEGGRGIAALSAPCPIFRTDEARQQEVLAHVRATAEQISRALSGTL